MNLHQMAENWNEQVTKLCNWTIDRLESPADKGDLKTTQTACQLSSVKPRRYTGQEEYHEIQH